MNKFFTFFSELYKKFSRQNEYLQAATVVIGICFIAFLFYLFSYSAITTKSEELLRPYLLSDELISKSKLLQQQPLEFPEDKFSTIQNQFAVLQHRKLYHLGVGLYFFKNSYATTLTTMMLSVFGALVLFALVNQGWRFAGIKLKATFFGILVASLFYSLFPTVFNQQDNYQKNLNRYIDYSTAQINICSRLSQLSNAPRTIIDTIDLEKNQFIWSIDSITYSRYIDTTIAQNFAVINTLDQFILTIDPDKVKSIEEIYQSIQNMAAKQNIADSTSF
jgi:hypothetical protein